MASEVGNLPIQQIIIGLGGGLALFLYGMRLMTEGLKTVAGGGMRTVLQRLTTNRFTGMASGALVTAVIQSSSITTVLLVGFITAGLLSFSQSFGVIIGANIGTTFTAQIIAFNVTKFALLFIGIGFFTEVIAKNNRIKQCGIILFGLGLIFFGMDLMKDATYPLRSFEPFMQLMQDMKNPLIGIAIGIVFTALVQSSSATTGIVIVLASQGLIHLDSGIAILLGANVGTCITALLSAIGKPREALQAAMAHVCFNVFGVLLWIAFIPELAALVELLSPASDIHDALARRVADTPRQLANAHTVFNLLNAFIFIWLIGPMSWIIQRLVPTNNAKHSESEEASFLDEMYVTQVDFALDRVDLELNTMLTVSTDMLEHAYDIVLHGDAAKIKDLETEINRVDLIHSRILAYLSKITLQNLLEGQPERINNYNTLINYIENVGDIIEVNFVQDAKKRLQQRLSISQEISEQLAAFHRIVSDAFRMAVQAIYQNNADKRSKVTGSKQAINQQYDDLRQTFSQLALADQALSLESFRFLMHILESLKRIHTLSRRIAEIGQTA